MYGGLCPPGTERIFMTNRKPAKLQTPQAGFTLVELIVVLVMVAILAGMVAPALLGMIDASKKKNEVAHAKAIYTAAQSKLSLLYDQGIMPNVEFHGEGNAGSNTGGYSWNGTWTEEVFYAAGISEKPYICGFYTGNLSLNKNSYGGQQWANQQSYKNQGLAALKSAYTIYIFVYLESKSGTPVIYCDGEWEAEVPEIENLGDGNRLFQLKDGRKIYLSALCVPLGCEGDQFNAAKTWSNFLTYVKKDTD